jgi:hypothetical protein
MTIWSMRPWESARPPDFVGEARIPRVAWTIEAGTVAGRGKESVKPPPVSQTARAIFTIF